MKFRKVENIRGEIWAIDIVQIQLQLLQQLRTYKLLLNSLEDLKNGKQEETRHNLQD